MQRKKQLTRREDEKPKTQDQNNFLMPSPNPQLGNSNSENNQSTSDSSSFASSTVAPSSLSFLEGSDNISPNRGPKDPENKYMERIALTSAFIEGATTKITDAVSTVHPVVANNELIKRFIPFVSDACKIILSIIDIYKAAEHNKSICGAILDRVYVAEAVIKYLHIRRDQKTEFFNEKNIKIVENLIKCMKEMEKFCKDVSKVTGWKKYLNAKLIDQDFKELTSRFEMYMKTLHFVISVETNTQARKERKLIKQDIKNTKEYLKMINYNISQAIEIQEANEAYKRHKNYDIKPSEPLNILNYELIQKIPKTKVELRRRNFDHQLFAFKLIPDVIPLSSNSAETQEETAEMQND
ncbi:10493_t:CDS:2, partial [Acaulospora morrowiae]